MTISRRIFPLALLVTGIITLASVIFPVGYSYLRYFLFRPPALLDPLATSGVPGSYVVNILGVATTDYTAPANWFSPAPVSPPVQTTVKYFTLTVPRLKLLDVPVEINGTDLKKNAIHYPGTALPGTLGNAVVFGHSALPQFYRAGNPLTIFNPLPDAKVGDRIVVNFDGVTYRYEIKNTAEVPPTEIEVLAQRFDRYELTLITCVPLGTYWHRFVARAELVN
jgi:sortase A